MALLTSNFEDSPIKRDIRQLLNDDLRIFQWLPKQLITILKHIMILVN